MRVKSFVDDFSFLFRVAFRGPLLYVGEVIVLRSQNMLLECARGAWRCGSPLMRGFE